MPNREKWADFSLIGTETKQSKRSGKEGETYAQFSCPYNCSVTIELPAANVKSKKASKCHDHLMKCPGVASDGQRAEDDSRVNSERVAASRCAAHMQAAKRGRTGEMTSATDGTLALREENTTLREQVTALQPLERRNEALVIRNDSLQGRVHNLEGQMTELRAESDARMETLMAELTQMKMEMRTRDERSNRLEAHLEQLSRALGFGAPPIPPIEDLTCKVAGMVKAVALSATTHAQTNAAKLRQKDTQIDDQRSVIGGLQAKIRDLEAKPKKVEKLLTSLARNSPWASKYFLVALHPDKLESDELRKRADSLRPFL